MSRQNPEDPSFSENNIINKLKRKHPFFRGEGVLFQIILNLIFVIATPLITGAAGLVWDCFGIALLVACLTLFSWAQVVIRRRVSETARRREASAYDAVYDFLEYMRMVAQQEGRVNIGSRRALTVSLPCNDVCAQIELMLSESLDEPGVGCYLRLSKSGLNGADGFYLLVGKSPRLESVGNDILQQVSTDNSVYKELCQLGGSQGRVVNVKDVSSELHLSSAALEDQSSFWNGRRVLATRVNVSVPSGLIIREVLWGILYVVFCDDEGAPAEGDFPVSVEESRLMRVAASSIASCLWAVVCEGGPDFNVCEGETGKEASASVTSLKMQPKGRGRSKKVSGNSKKRKN